jgi:Na+-translocating ferredoxin:NAD+ oxidoreductase RnfD subunit
MSAPALARVGGPTLRIRGTRYPVLLPTLRDPRLHLAAVIVSLQVLGQVAFDFRLSIAQILVALLTSALLEVGITFRRERVIMWPASALLTGNGVAFILRVPGTEHGDWWSMHGWWIFAGTAAVSLLSKYVIRFRGGHVFNPSNFGLVLCFLVLGAERAEPLDFWWGPMSAALAFALAIIVTGGLAILTRLRLLGLAVGFWLAFAIGIGVLAASGHAMTARWHLGPISDGAFWRALVFSPEILVFLFFMITDPKTVPAGRAGRRVFGVVVGLLAVLLIAPQSTEFGSKVAVLAALALVCAARPLVELLSAAGSADSVAARVMRLVRGEYLGAGAGRRAAVGAMALAGAVGFVGLVVLAGIPARTSVEAASALTGDAGGLPEVTVLPSKGVASQLDRRTAQQIAHAVVADLRSAADALQRRDIEHATASADGDWLAGLRRQIREATGRSIVVPAYNVERMRVTLEPGEGQGPPIVVATLEGTVELATYSQSPLAVEHRSDAARFERTFECAFVDGRLVIVRARGAATQAPVTPAVVEASSSHLSVTGFVSPHLNNVAEQVGLNFSQSAFRYKVTTTDPVAMMGGGLCWLDYDSDGWMDLFVVNSYSELDVAQWKKNGGLPRSALFHNVKGRFVDVSRGSGADLSLRGNGCVAADFDLDGHPDLYVTTATYDALLRNGGDGTFTEGARAAGIDDYGWHAGAAVGDVNGDGRPDLFVAGYTNLNAPIPDSFEGFPTRYQGVRDLLYLNEGRDQSGQLRFREVGRQAGLEPAEVDHSLGAVFSDLNGDRRLDLYVANDEDPNRLYQNVPWLGGPTADPAGLGFRFKERAKTEDVDDPNAGMGIAAADYGGDGRPDLFVSNSRGQRHAVYRSRRPGASGRSFADARSDFASAFGTSYVGWGASWVDLDLDGDLDLVLANGAIPVKDLAADAEPIQVLENLAAQGGARQFTDAGGTAGQRKRLRVNGRGLAAADFDNDGDVDVAINTIGGRLVLLENTNETGNWLEVALKGFHPGTRVAVVLPDGSKLVREVLAGSSYLSSEDPRIHFGLGKVTRVIKLIVSYPDGRETRLTGVAPNQVVEVTPELR